MAINLTREPQRRRLLAEPFHSAELVGRRRRWGHAQREAVTHTHHWLPGALRGGAGGHHAAGAAAMAAPLSLTQGSPGSPLHEGHLKVFAQSLLGPGSDSVDLHGPENVHFERVTVVMASAALHVIHAGSSCLTGATAVAVRGSLCLP